MVSLRGHNSLIVSRETDERLKLFAELVTKWNPAINLVSKDSVDRLFQRHIMDSLQLLSVAPEACNHWVDLGSGGGFPGIVVAIAGRETGYPERITLVESDKRKAVFLREAARELRLNVKVLNERIDSIPCLQADVLSARALARLTKLCEFAYLHMRRSGLAIFPKGANREAEIAEARESWSFLLDTTPSETSPDAAILTLRNIFNV